MRRGESRRGQALATLTLRHAAGSAPLVYAVPVQLIAYHTPFTWAPTSISRRNLAKSVTVE